MKTTLPELIKYIKDKIPRLRLYDIFMILCLIDKELVGRRGFSLTGLEWTYKDSQLHWEDEEVKTELELNREAKEVTDQIIESAKDIEDEELRDLVKKEFV